MTRHPNSGVSLLNVLAVLAVGASLVQVMVQDQEIAIQRLAQDNDLAQARALAQGGVTSVAVALRRDFANAPDTDHLGEAWAQAAQDHITLDFGQFKVAIADARGKFDLNTLHPAAVAELRVFTALLAALDLPTALASPIAQAVAQEGPLASPEDLADHGIAQSDVERLLPNVTATKSRGTLNLNSVTPELMVALTRNPAAARGLLARRAAKGFLDQSDFAALGLPLPLLSGFTSDTYDVTVVASVADARSVLSRRLQRDPETGAVQNLPRP